MSDDQLSPREQERKLIEQLKPTINMMGAQSARDRSTLNGLVRKQLDFTKEVLDSYIADVQMPHEWGSMDSYDDMRNSLRASATMLDAVVSPEMFLPEGTDLTTDDGVKAFIRQLAKEDVGICCFHEEVVQFADLDSIFEED